MTTTNFQDPLAVVRNAVTEALAAVKENNEKFTAVAEAEAAKARKAAVANLDLVTATHRANLDAGVAVAKATIDGLTEIADLTKSQVTTVLEGQAADVQTLLAVDNPKDALAVQAGLVKAAQKQTAAFAQELATVTQKVANDVLKPVQATVAANLKKAQQVQAA
jgi:phasin family protein